MSAPGNEERFMRNIMMYGPAGFRALQESFVAVVGLGGVGSCAAEALVRAGIGRLRLVDCDVVKASDINRQLIALSTNIGMGKTEAAAMRLRAVNPEVEIDARHAFFHADTADELLTRDLHFVIDAIDSLNPKGELIRHCRERHIPLVSAMGAAGRRDPLQIRVGLLDATRICPLARALRRHLRSRNIATDIPVVYSEERPIEAHEDAALPERETSGTYVRGRSRAALPSLPTIPAMFGLIAANYVIMELLAANT